ncbi:UDP-N-acetylmuramate--L-alanine ligase [Haloplasma contractile]|uniref:UDP-N-acetylmuramate--L-alanine ligase n=1 Tax=Haloplasma contractile SSD-17B TaxID=1033810 RepID=U2EFB4_9MOLU|nr:UDP-N-acetylmuramate--L-alanine ligase [Haloplasma contractile]ERJ13628.1 UDP-N-acetylmuramate--L-alanine ligase protein [Haloplasma contractile SSD-17B]
MKNYHFIGIKGAGMSALACILHDLGNKVQGSDVTEYFFTEENLKKRDIPIYTFNVNKIDSTHTVIVGNAFNDHKEVTTAKCLGCKIYSYNEFLGNLCNQFNSIAVTGSHGKTTTTNLIAHILSNYLEINFLVGDGEGKGNQAADTFVFEACEYKRHFLHYTPNISVITNVDFDHPDYYKDIEDVQSAFKQFGNQSDFLIANGDDPSAMEITKEGNTLYFGLKNTNNLYATNINYDSNYTFFDAIYNTMYLESFKIPLHGTHSVMNALAAILVALRQSVPVSSIKSSLQTFKGTQRRFEEIPCGDQLIINDYAHHPVEIKATINAIRSKYPNKPLVVFFQPHTYTRTITFLDEFVNSLSLADHVYLLEIFGSAREKTGQITIQDLSNRIEGSRVIDKTELEILNQYKNSVIVFMGAGDIDQLIKTYMQS